MHRVVDLGAAPEAMCLVHAEVAIHDDAPGVAFPLAPLTVNLERTGWPQPPLTTVVMGEAGAGARATSRVGAVPRPAYNNAASASSNERLPARWRARFHHHGCGGGAQQEHIEKQLIQVSRVNPV